MVDCPAFIRDYHFLLLDATRTLTIRHVVQAGKYRCNYEHLHYKNFQSTIIASSRVIKDGRHQVIKMTKMACRRILVSTDSPIPTVDPGGSGNGRTVTEFVTFVTFSF